MRFFFRRNTVITYNLSQDTLGVFRIYAITA